MAALLGIAPGERRYGAIHAGLSPELNARTEARLAPATYLRSTLRAPASPLRAIATTAWPVAGRRAHRHADDLFDRIHLWPQSLALGHLVSEQRREILVWNAWRDEIRRLTSLRMEGEIGGTLVAPGALPWTLRPLQETTVVLEVAAEGPPTVDAQVALGFDDGTARSLSVTGLRLVVWPLPADWSEPLTESLAWLTDVQTTLSGVRQRTPLRAAPRRRWEFNVLADRQERRLVEHALYDGQARVWALPLFVDTAWLARPLPAGSDRIPLQTAGMDLVVGGLAMLWQTVLQHDLVEIAAIAPDHLQLRTPTRRTWPVGTRLIPCRAARLEEAPSLRRHHDRLTAARLRFEAIEPCDWPAVPPAARYRGLPVLEHHGDTSRTPTATFTRELARIDGEVGGWAIDDFSGQVTATQSHAWRLSGRAERTAHRSLLYWLQGRAEALWLPTWTDDLQLIAPVGASALTLTVAASGIARHLRQQSGRRHLRIELHDGRTFHRALEAASEREGPGGITTEQLRIDLALGVAVVPEQVRLICWLALCTLAGDTVEIEHHTGLDGLADVALAFTSLGAEEP